MPPPLDLETKLVTALVEAEVLGGHLSTRLPTNFADLLPYGTLRRAPGSAYVDSQTQTLEKVRLQLNTYGPIGGDTEAFAAMATLTEALSELAGTGFAGIFITNVDITQTPAWSPDPESERPGYLAFAIIFVKAYREL